MTNEEIIEKYKAKPEDIFYKLAGDRIVLGEEVDDKNRLLYVIKNTVTGEYTVELAFNQPILSHLKNALDRND